MKKIFLSLFLLIFSLNSHGQLSGQFAYGNDGHIYFYLTNSSVYQIPVTWGAYNFQRNEQRQGQGVMMPNNTFIFGPNYGWTWLRGERFAVTYSNGQTQYWECPNSDPAVGNNPSFRGNPSTKCNILGHGCTGFIDRNGDEWCDVCLSHNYKCHKVRH